MGKYVSAMEVTLELDKEIIDGFREEANIIIGELRGITGKLEDAESEFPKALLEEFANKTDRLMGTASTFDTNYPGYPVFNQIRSLSELCKATGYKASVLNNQSLVPIFAAFWEDTLDILEELIANVDDHEKLKEVTKNFLPTLQKRLVWLAQQIVNITKGSGASEQAAINVDGLLKKLGFDV